MTMKQFAIRYEILRGVSSTGRAPCAVQPSEKPIRVAYLHDEKKFVESGGLLQHHDTVFLEDSGHDWDWRQNRERPFYYYGHAMGPEDVGDIVVVFETSDQPVFAVCEVCGARHAPGQNTLCER
jgi:hypothetical protein